MPAVISAMVWKNPGWYTAYIALSGGSQPGSLEGVVKLSAGVNRFSRHGAGQRLIAG